MTWRRLLLAALIAALPSTVFAAPHEFDFGERLLESVGTEDDIPNGVITALAQGDDGYLWIGTQQGLLRFDGYRFRRYVHRVDDPQSMAGDFVFSLAVGTDGRVWVGHEVDGVSVLDPATETFTRYRHDPNEAEGIGPGNIYAIAVAPDGGVYIAGDSRLTRFDPNTQHFTELILDTRATPPGSGGRVRSLLSGRDGSLWIGTQDGVWRKRAGHLAAEALLTHGDEALAGREVVALMESDDAALWVGTRENGAARVDPETGAILWIGRDHAEADALSRSWINAIAQTGDEVWLSRYGAGIALVGAKDRSVRHLLTQDASVRDGLSFDAAGAFQVDRAGLLWIGSWGGGLQRYNPRNPGLRLLRHSALRAGKLSYPNLLSVLELRDGRVLAGTTQNGIDIIDPVRGVVGGWRVDPKQPGMLGDGVIGGLAEAEDGTLWVGTFQAGVYRLDPGATRFRHYTREHGLPTLQTEAIDIARDGRVFIGTGDGLVRYDAARDHFVDVLALDGKPPRTRFNGMAEAADGMLWFGSASGLHALDPGAERLRHYQHDPADPASLGNDVVANVIIDRSGGVWVNTQLGIDRYMRAADGRGRFEHVLAKIGMAGESLGSNLLEDAQGRLWTSTAVFDPKTMRVQKLHRSDGLDVGTNWIGSATKTRSGLLLFGGTNGLGIVDPARFRAWSHRPRVLITAVNVDGVRRPQDAVRREILIAADEARFDVEFSADDFSAPATTRYAYRLLGNGTPGWVEVDADHRHAGFGNLWPGAYTLEVRATNRVGETSAEPARVAIRVLPKLWQRPVSLLVAALLAMLLLAGLVRISIAHYRSRAVLLQALVDERTAALRDAYARVELSSRTDPMTGLGNRRSLEAAMPLLAEQVVGACAGGGVRRRLAVFIVDIDDFKTVNDLYGHVAGDRVIQAVAMLIRAQLRDGDIGVRWGGEEFLIVAQLADETEALQLGERLRLAVMAHAFDLGEGRIISKTCSIGFACLPFAPAQAHALSWQHVLEIADGALYEAKHDGRNRVYGYRANGTIDAHFIERFRRTPPHRRGELPIMRILA